MKVIDEAQLRAGFEKMRADLMVFAAKDDVEGCCARAQLAAGEQIQRFVCNEVERGTQSGFIAKAICTFASNSVASFIRGFDIELDAKVTLAEQFAAELLASVLYRLDDNNIGDAKFKADIAEGGRA